MRKANEFEYRSDPASLISTGSIPNPLLIGAAVVESLDAVLVPLIPRLSDVIGNGSLGPRE
jgi:hypothetical protein